MWVLCSTNVWVLGAYLILFFGHFVGVCRGALSRCLLAMGVLLFLFGLGCSFCSFFCSGLSRGSKQMFFLLFWWWCVELMFGYPAMTMLLSCMLDYSYLLHWICLLCWVFLLLVFVFFLFFGLSMLASALSFWSWVVLGKGPGDL